MLKIQSLHCSTWTEFGSVTFASVSGLFLSVMSRAQQPAASALGPAASAAAGRCQESCSAAGGTLAKEMLNVIF